MVHAVEFNNVMKRYKHFHLNGFTFQLPKGQVMGLIGANGAGKSTLIRILMGLVHQDSGSVQVLGNSMPEDHVKSKRQIGYMSEDMRLYEKASLDWHMRWVANVFPDWDQSYAVHLCDRFDLRSEQNLKEFSHGQRVKAGLLLALAHRPRLLVLDEPTTGLDPVARAEVFQELMEVLKDEERTILFSSHNTYDVEKLSDVITFIDHGVLVDSRDKETFLDHWKRVRIVAPADSLIQALDGVVSVHQSGRLASVVTASQSPALLERLKACGEIQAVENLTLEEIFIAAVRSSREKTKGVTV